ncbi:MAG: FAD-dependent oxidoreductase [Nitrospinota bacterium]|nr:FAD-dependent oxidoreductase [Nitrospinota bacterium]
MIGSQRIRDMEIAQNETFDVTIIGGGINGASLYHQLCRKGYRVLLVDKGDFACGTSQASAMMVWGGLLYLRNLDLLTVAQLSRDREAMIQNMGCEVSPVSFRYIPSRDTGWNKFIMAPALYFYWMLGLCNRDRPRVEDSYSEKSFLIDNAHDSSFLYQEAILNSSDSRFVLKWITEQDSNPGIALNYCSLTGGEYHSGEKIWRLTLTDEITGWARVAKSWCVINCAGVWTDTVNRQFQIETPYKHVFSKGVFIGLERQDQHNYPLIFDMGEQGDVLSYIPWGPVALWGPTETCLSSIEGGVHTEPEDVDFLLERANRHLKQAVDPSDIVSLRCGVRPLVVKKDYSKNRYPLDLSRKHQISRDSVKPWISVYGGKFTSCVSLAEKVEEQIRELVEPGQASLPAKRNVTSTMQWESYPGLQDPVPSLKWCIEKEHCLTLEDYLRRRTNISQWVPREGLGRNDENVPHLEQLALQFSGGEPVIARKLVLDYMETVERRFDSVLNSVY